MSPLNMKQAFSVSRLLPVMMSAATLLLAAAAQAAAPGITGPTFNLTAQPAHISQPDGNYIYSWGYGCNGAPTGFAPAAIAGAPSAGPRPARAAHAWIRIRCRPSDRAFQSPKVAIFAETKM